MAESRALRMGLAYSNRNLSCEAFCTKSAGIRARVRRGSTERETLASATDNQPK